MVYRQYLNRNIKNNAQKYSAKCAEYNFKLYCSTFQVGEATF